jgi:hypothetical protein
VRNEAGVFPSYAGKATAGANGVTQAYTLQAVVSPLEGRKVRDTLRADLTPGHPLPLQFASAGHTFFSRPAGMGRESNSHKADDFFLEIEGRESGKRLGESPAKSPSEALCFKPDSFRSASVRPTVPKLSGAFWNGLEGRLRASFSHSQGFIGLGTNGNRTPCFQGHFRRRDVGNTGVKMGWTYLGRKRSAVRIRAPRPTP